MTEQLYLLSMVIAVAAVILLFFVPLRWLAERVLAIFRRSRADDPPVGTLISEDDQDTDDASPWAQDLDRRFGALVRQTGTSWTPGYALTAMTLFTALTTGIVYLLTGNLAYVTLALAVSVLLSVCVLLILRARWRRKVQQQMPDAFFLLARSLRAGQTLDQALASAASMGPMPLAGELHYAVEQGKLGLAPPTALQNVARKLDMVDFDSFVMTVSLHRNVGGNLSALLDRLATSVRDRNLFRGFFRSATALGRVTAVFLALAAPAIFVGSLFLQPEFMERFLASAEGFRWLGVAGALEVVGCAWVYWLLRLDF